MPDLVFGGWYDYDFMTHTLSPADMLYFLRAVDGTYYWLRFLDYYDNDGTSGMITLEYGEALAPVE